MEASDRGYCSLLVGGLLVLGSACLVGITGALAGAAAPQAPGVPVPMAVPVDIRPGLCPNHLSLTGALTVPVAILGTVDFDIENIDPETVRLSREGAPGECAPASWTYKDVGTPMIGASPECNDRQGDGLDDLKLDFSVADLAANLGLGEHAGEAVQLNLTGKIVTGQGIEGRDWVIVIGGREDAQPRDEIGLLAQPKDAPAGNEMDLAYYTNTSDHITFTIHDARGRVVAKLVDADKEPGIYRVSWARIGADHRQVPPGTYFARLANSRTGTTTKLVLQ
jgi:hypothetical protein